MPLPQIEKQWVFDVNQQYTGDPPPPPDPPDPTALVMHQRVLRGIKNSLTSVLAGKTAMTSPWVVKRSSNGTVVGQSDLWGNDAELVFSPSAHSWIVLEQPGISESFQICIDLKNADPTKLTIVWAPDGFPETGSTNERPIAATEVVLMNDVQWLGGQTTDGIRIHAMQSVDGECTRVVGYWQGHPVLFWLFDKPARTVAGWSLPAIALATGSYDGNVTYQALHTVSTPNLRGYAPSAPLSFWMSTESFGSSPAAIGAQLTGSNAFDSNWVLTPIGLACLDPGQRGRHGEIADLWFGSSGANSGDTYPDDGSRQFAQFGHLVFPWDGTPEEDGSTPAIDS